MVLRLLSLLAVFLSLGSATLQGYVQQTNLGGMLYLVNRDLPLTREYVPDDLVKPEVRGSTAATRMQREAAAALESLFAAAEEAGHKLVAVSGYRSYSKQRTLWGRKVSNTGSEARAQLLVALPGTSEHQLGLAMDIGRKGAASLNARFGESPEGQWVAEHAHEHGFIIRYKAEWTGITGYAWEPWHLRYVGPEHAGRIQALDIPLEHYVAQLLAAQEHRTMEGLP